MNSKSKVISVKDRDQVLENGICIDTSVLYLVFGPEKKEKDRERREDYSDFLSWVLKNKIPLYITHQVSEEYVTNYLQFDFRKYEETRLGKIAKKECRGEWTCRYKRYRKIQRGKDWIEQVLDRFKSVLDGHKIEIVGTNINQKLTLELLDQANLATFDYGDMIIARDTENCDLALLTDDADFGSTSSDIEVITANPRLLRESQK